MASSTNLTSSSYNKSRNISEYTDQEIDWLRREVDNMKRYRKGNKNDIAKWEDVIKKYDAYKAQQRNERLEKEAADAKVQQDKDAIPGSTYDYSEFSYDALPDESYDQHMARLKKAYKDAWKPNVFSGSRPGVDLGDIPLIGRLVRPEAREIPKELQEKYPEYYASMRHTVGGDFNHFGYGANDAQKSALYSHLGELDKRINEQDRLRTKYGTRSYESGTQKGILRHTLNDWQRALDDGAIDKIIPQTEAEDTTINFVKQRASNKDNKNIYLPRNDENEEQYNRRVREAMKQLLLRNGIKGEMQDALSTGNYSITSRWNDSKLWRNQEEYQQYMNYYNSLMGHADKIRQENKYMRFGQGGMEGILPGHRRARIVDTSIASKNEKPKGAQSIQSIQSTQPTQPVQPKSNTTPAAPPKSNDPAPTNAQPTASNTIRKDRSDETERLSRLADRLNNRQYYKGTRGTTSVGQQVGPAQSAGHYQMDKIETEDMRQQGINRELRAMTNKLEREGQAYTRQRARQLLADIHQWRDLDKQRIIFEQLNIPKDKIDYIMGLPTEQRMIAAQVFIGGGAKIPGYAESALYKWLDPYFGRGK